MTQLYAAYVDVTAYHTDTDPITSPDLWHCRWQYVIMPRLPGHPNNVIFSRFQNRKGHRAVWKGYPYHDLSSLITGLEQNLRRQNSNVRPPIVVPIALSDALLYVPDPHVGYKTPWKVLEAAAKRATQLGYTL